VKYGVNFTVNTDASITITGTSSSDKATFLLRTGSLPKGKYSFKCLGLPDDCSATIYYIGKINGETEKQFTVSDESQNHSIEIRVPNGTTVDATLKPVLVFGESVGEYVAQKGEKAAIQPDGGLYALPVTDGGNYTDENSQQWICDTAEFDTEKGGKIVRRVKKFEITEESLTLNKYTVSDISKYTGVKDTVTNFRIFHKIGTDTGSQSMCSHLKRYKNVYNADVESQYCIVADSVDIALSYDVLNITSEADSSERVEACKAWMKEQAKNGTPLTFIVELRENEEANLSDEETEEFSKLQTYSSATNIFTDNVSGVGVCYVADTKKYIDNKFEELKSAILSMGGNV
jgi:ASC-1-like (ASCH) protein